MSFMTCFTLFSLANAVEWSDKKNSSTNDYSSSLIFITQEFLWFRCFLCLYFLSLVFSGWTRLTQLCVHEKFLRLLPETRLDLTAGIYTTFVLAVQRIVLEIVKSYSWIIWCDKNLKRKQEKTSLFIWKLFETLKHIPPSAVLRLSRWPLRTMITSQAPNENWKCIIKYIYQRVSIKPRLA